VIIISHRGNLNGPFPERENCPDYIEHALSKNYDVEIDVWHDGDDYFLGHDKPQYKISLVWLKHSNRLWCHAKNIKALEKMQSDMVYNFFWHEEDKFTLTSRGYIWCYPKNYSELGIIVDKDNSLDMGIRKYFGVCTDYPNGK